MRISRAELGSTPCVLERDIYFLQFFTSFFGNPFFFSSEAEVLNCKILKSESSQRHLTNERLIVNYLLVRHFASSAVSVTLN